jgi:hypothetical protein
LFSLEIKVEGFCTTDSNGRKAYTKGSVIKWDVEVGSFSFELLMQSLTNEFKWSPSQSPCLWFFDKRMCEDIRLVNDFQMRDLFEMYKDQMHCQVVVGVYERTVVDVDEFASLEPLCVISLESNQDPVLNPHNPPTTKPAISPGTKPTTKPDGGPEYPSDPELEPDRQPDMFDNEKEYVGVDDEGMYMPVPPHQQTNNAHA